MISLERENNSNLYSKWSWNPFPIRISPKFVTLKFSYIRSLLFVLTGEIFLKSKYWMKHIESNFKKSLTKGKYTKKHFKVECVLVLSEASHFLSVCIGFLWVSQRFVFQGWKFVVLLMFPRSVPSKRRNSLLIYVYVIYECSSPVRCSSRFSLFTSWVYWVFCFVSYFSWGGLVKYVWDRTFVLRTLRLTARSIL